MPLINKAYNNCGYAWGHLKCLVYKNRSLPPKRKSNSMTPINERSEVLNVKHDGLIVRYWISSLKNLESYFELYWCTTVGHIFAVPAEPKPK